MFQPQNRPLQANTNPNNYPYPYQPTDQHVAAAQQYGLNIDHVMTLACALIDEIQGRILDGNYFDHNVIVFDNSIVGGYQNNYFDGLVTIAVQELCTICNGRQPNNNDYSDATYVALFHSMQMIAQDANLLNQFDDQSYQTLMNLVGNVPAGNQVQPVQRVMGRQPVQPALPQGRILGGAQQLLGNQSMRQTPQQQMARGNQTTIAQDVPQHVIDQINSQRAPVQQPQARSMAGMVQTRETAAQQQVQPQAQPQQSQQAQTPQVNQNFDWRKVEGVRIVKERMPVVLTNEVMLIGVDEAAGELGIVDREVGLQMNLADHEDSILGHYKMSKHQNVSTTTKRRVPADGEPRPGQMDLGIYADGQKIKVNLKSEEDERPEGIKVNESVIQYDIPEVVEPSKEMTWVASKSIMADRGSDQKGRTNTDAFCIEVTANVFHPVSHNYPAFDAAKWDESNVFIPSAGLTSLTGMVDHFTAKRDQFIDDEAWWNLDKILTDKFNAISVPATGLQIGSLADDLKDFNTALRGMNDPTLEDRFRDVALAHFKVFLSGATVTDDAIGITERVAILHMPWHSEEVGLSLRDEGASILSESISPKLFRSVHQYIGRCLKDPNPICTSYVKTVDGVWCSAHAINAEGSAIKLMKR